MPEGRSEISNSQTLVIDFNDLNYEAVEQQNGVATVVKFKLENPGVNAGDVLLVLAGEDIQFISRNYPFFRFSIFHLSFVIAAMKFEQ